MLTYAVVGMLCLSFGTSHPYYRDRIPNGYAVPNPCDASTYWEAVGHYDPIHHTHEKNPFAQDFVAQGRFWTAELCHADSDGDGVTNGAELGDPTCTWQPGATPSARASGHPGICNPPGSCGDSFTCNCHGHSCTVGRK